jgi:hypothetical protein
MFFNFGIILQIIGFVVLLLVSGRNPTSSVLLMENHKDSPFDIERKRIIPDKYVHVSLYSAITIVICGLIL